MAILDLQARIQDELTPDYLLIDARTGVTEIGSLAATILADTVVCMFVGNRESLDGTLAVMEALKNAPRFANQNPIRVVPVLSRTMEFDVSLRDSVQRFLNVPALFVVPHDPLATAEHVGSSPFYMACMELFRELFPSATKTP
jgi:MinD-like ATPase involved in chromosome partitioning or flagellar assembly